LSDAWRYPKNLSDPEAVKLLLQAALTAHATITFAQTKVNPEDFETVPDWNAVRRELHSALAAAGHPAGDASRA
jgi:hypothetical protein